MIWPLDHVLETWQVHRADKLFDPPRPDQAYSKFNALADRIVVVAQGEIGNGEVGKNNMGPHVAKYLAPTKPPAFWCAGSAGWVAQEAAHQLHIPLPFKRSLSAKTLGKNVAAAGHRFDSPFDALPGDFGILHRGDHGSTKGHVFIFAERPYVKPGRGLVLPVYEGNAGGFPSVFRAHTYRLSDVDWAFGASLRRGPAVGSGR